MRFVHLAAAACCIASSSGAQSVAPRVGPDSVVRVFLRAIEEERWYDATELVELGPFEAALQQTIDAALRPQREQWTLTVDELRRQDPDMPIEVAEYQVRKWRDQRESHPDPVLYLYAHVATVDSLAKLSTRWAAARRLEASDTRYMMRRALTQTRARCMDSVTADSLVRTMTPPLPKIVGHVIEGDIAFVVLNHFASGFGGADLPGHRPTVVRVVRYGGRWLVRDWENWRGDFAVGFTPTCEPAQFRR